MASSGRGSNLHKCGNGRYTASPLSACLAWRGSNKEGPSGMLHYPTVSLAEPLQESLYRSPPTPKEPALDPPNTKHSAWRHAYTEPPATSLQAPATPFLRDILCSVHPAPAQAPLVVRHAATRAAVLRRQHRASSPMRLRPGGEDGSAPPAQPQAPIPPLHALTCLRASRTAARPALRDVGGIRRSGKATLHAIHAITDARRCVRIPDARRITITKMKGGVFE
ncbi:hypothetical protein HWV62_37095 [Athelia sp. TMB]|nr:hypothetical protein HWV62_37095 [Athelia sp. TMB]